MASAGPYANLHHPRQITMPAPHHSDFYTPDARPAAQPTKVGMHQGSALSPLLFVIAMGAIHREFRVALSWELLYADGLVVIAETEEDLIKRLNE